MSLGAGIALDFIEPCFGIGHNLSLICQMTSEDIKHQLIIIIIETELIFNPGRMRLMFTCMLKPVLNWANVCSPERTSDTSTNYDSFFN